MDPRRYCVRRLITDRQHVPESIEVANHLPVALLDASAHAPLLPPLGVALCGKAFCVDCICLLLDQSVPADMGGTGGGG